jgi:ferredoxin--NADP+ reductase
MDHKAAAVTDPAATAPKFTRAPIVWVHRWNPGLVSFRVAKPRGYRFQPGQFARIGIERPDAETLWRAYSIVSAPAEEFLEFFLVVLPQGEFSSRVGRFNLGDELLVEPAAQGFLTLDRFQPAGTPLDLWLIATGTGLAPYVSMLRDSKVWAAFARIVLVLSVRDKTDLAYEEELAGLESAAAPGRARLHRVVTLTRDHRHGALQGRIPALFDNGEIERACGVRLDEARSRFMLCGNPAMVEAMRKLLKSKGFRMNRRLEPGHIIVENYW